MQDVCFFVIAGARQHQISDSSCRLPTKSKGWRAIALAKQDLEVLLTVHFHKTGASNLPAYEFPSRHVGVLGCLGRCRRGGSGDEAQGSRMVTRWHSLNSSTTQLSTR